MNDDSGPWLYKPDGQTVSQQPDFSDTGRTQDNSSTGSADSKTMTWTASEYIDHTRGAGWYLALVGGTVILAAVIYLVTKEYFAVGVILTLGIVVGIFSTQKPKQLTYELSESGLKAGEKDYPLSLFKSFALINEGALSSISLIPNRRFMPPFSVYFEPSDETKITDILGAHLPLEEGGLDTIERLARRLRL